jgi:hypothetical protein
VVVPYSRPAPGSAAGRVEQLGRQGPAADAGAVGLEDAEDPADLGGATPAPWQAPAAVGDDEVTKG